MVMTSPVTIPLYGRLKKSEIQKEELLAIWTGLVEKHKLNIHVGEKVEGLVKKDGYYSIQTSKKEVLTKTIVLCLGRRGTPRKLGIPGEDLLKVTYGLIDPDAYQGKNILVVGGGDSAIEAAAVLAPHNNVTISYRNEQFFRIKKKNADKVEEAIKNKKIKFMFKSQVKEIREDSVTINHDGQKVSMENDFIFILAGGEPAFPLLRSIGVLRDPKDN
jgi:thioredoxin reductase